MVSPARVKVEAGSHFRYGPHSSIGGDCCGAISNSCSLAKPGYNEDVRGFDVAMDDAFLVGSVHTLCDLDRHVE